MARITKLLIDTVANKLIISATSTGKTTDDTSTYHHKFTTIKFDVTDTFNCSNEPSSVATTHTLNIGFDTDLVNYEVSLADILPNNPTLDLFFIWLEEYEYKLNTSIDGFVDTVNNQVYLTDGTNYFKAAFSSMNITESNLTTTTSTEYTTALSNEDSNYVVNTYKDTVGNLFIEIIEAATNTVYFKADFTNNYSTESITLQTFLTNVCTSVNFQDLFGVTLSVRDFYNLMLERVTIEDVISCKATCSDVNCMLAWNGFNLAKSLREYKQMIYYWKILHNVVTSSYNCNCNG